MVSSVECPALTLEPGDEGRIRRSKGRSERFAGRKVTAGHHERVELLIVAIGRAEAGGFSSEKDGAYQGHLLRNELARWLALVLRTKAQ